MTTQIPSIQAWVTEEAPSSPNPKTPAKYHVFTADREYIEVYGAQGLPVGTCVQVVASTNSAGANFFRVLTVLHLGSGVMHPSVVIQMSDDPDQIEKAYEELENETNLAYPDVVETENEVDSESVTMEGEAEEPVFEAEPVEEEEMEAKPEPVEEPATAPKRKRRSKAEIEAEKQASKECEVETDANAQAYFEAGEPCPNPIVEAIINSALSQEAAEDEQVKMPLQFVSSALSQRLGDYIYVHKSLVDAGIEPLPHIIKLILEF